jgi:hypothetical protein
VVSDELVAIDKHRMPVNDDAVISPELVLVDPELAAAARDAAWREASRRPPLPAVDVRRPRPASPRSRIRITALAVFLACAGCVLLGRWATGQLHPTSADGAGSAPRVRSGASRQPRTRPSVAAPTTVLLQTRAWAWPAVADASFYRITFRHAGHVAFRGIARSSTYRLPTHVHFAPGRYTWSVVPVRGHRTLPPVVRASFAIGSL